MTVLAKDAGVLGIPLGEKETGGRRIDFRYQEFAVAVEAKGARVAWSRAAQCPCASTNEQTNQADPTCSLCQGTGWILFRPVGAVTDELKTGYLDPLQTIIVGTNSAVVRALMTAYTAQYAPRDKVSPREQGTVNVTMRAENKMGYYDRIVNLDSAIIYSQILDSTGDRLPAKYWIREINLLRSINRIYTVDTDFTIVDGQIQWVAGHAPATHTRLVCHYLTHPVWRVMEHPHATRYTVIKRKVRKPVTPRGDEKELPVQAVARLEFLL
jgi:hypothetical protein